MGLNDTASADRLHIGFFGVRNAGKSSVVNAVAAQELSVVSEVLGTTTDPVKKAMEILPLGPAVIIDTPGIDDEGKLGELRVKKSRQVLEQTDIAVLITDAVKGLCGADRELIEIFKERNLPYIVAYNKSDLLTERKKIKSNEIYISAVTGENIYELKEKIGNIAKGAKNNKHIVSDLFQYGDIAVLVIPIDESAPKGRLILPQQQTIRDILDARCSCVCCRETELKDALRSLTKKPRLVITDSQVFERVAKDTPEDIMLTSFSILFARYKGNLPALSRGAAALSKIKSGDKILIAEGCTHHRQCADIGTVKLPAWIELYTGAKPEYNFVSGGDFPENLSAYSLIIHCGGCMLNEKAVQSRINRASRSGIPIVNYGIAIAQMNGILKRALAPFPDITADFD